MSTAQKNSSVGNLLANLVNPTLRKTGQLANYPPVAHPGVHAGGANPGANPGVQVGLHAGAQAQPGAYTSQPGVMEFMAKKLFDGQYFNGNTYYCFSPFNNLNKYTLIPYTLMPAEIFHLLVWRAITKENEFMIINKHILCDGGIKCDVWELAFPTEAKKEAARIWFETYLKDFPSGIASFNYLPSLPSGTHKNFTFIETYKDPNRFGVPETIENSDNIEHIEKLISMIVNARGKIWTISDMIVFEYEEDAIEYKLRN